MSPKEKTYDVYYDGEADFLEVSFGEPAQEGTTEETEPGIFVTRDIDTSNITNIGILDFTKRVAILKQVLHQYHLAFPFDITLSR